ncbi:helix-turn-helix transcriptional regulator [Streptacidiphilus rugosus]|uniref:helix-turn-helix transcriptional regulator n=1 Tax=Streptacidiphilus rugosus TaxID=405783 RepID=UPI0005643BBF|nr:AAA family ATPase [Streptacidiphilus rugosus]
MGPGAWDSGIRAARVSVGTTDGGSARWGSVFVGRARELETFAKCRAEVAGGTPWLVTVEGEAGIGKTSLVHQALGGAEDGLRVCWTGCDRAEQDYPYGVLDQLLRHLPSDAPGVRDLARSLTPTASPITVGVDLLDMLASATDTGPLALVVDDIPWSDPQSLNALAFVLRRLYSEPVLVVVTARTAAAPIAAVSTSDGHPVRDWRQILRGIRIQRFSLTGLSAAETGQLATAPGAPRLPDPVTARLLERTAGHPLHLRSLLTQITPAELADLSHPLPVPASLDAVVCHTLDRLPGESRRLVEALAVLGVPTPLATAGRLAGIGDAPRALGPALDVGLVAWEPDQPTTPVRIHHQLQCDAVYQAISPSRRQALHTTAATLVSADDAWAHRVAAATVGHRDRDLERELAVEAGHEAAQGRYDRAATLQLWAADLAPTREQYETHLVTAATGLLTGQAYGRAHGLRDLLDRCAPSPRRDAALGYLLAFAGEDPPRAEHLLIHARDTATDPAVRLLAGTWLGIAYHLRADGPRTVAALRPVVDQLPSGATAHHARGTLAYAVGCAEGPGIGLGVIAEAGLLDKAAQVPHPDSPMLTWRGMLRVRAGHLASGIEDLTVLLARQRTDPGLPTLAVEHFMLAFARHFVGRYEDAASSADQALLTADIQAQPWALAPGHAAAVLAHAQQGHDRQTRTHLEACHRHARLFPGLTSIFPILAEAVWAQAQDDHAAMLRALLAIDDPNAVAPGMRNQLVVQWAPLLVEAATGTAEPTGAELRRARQALGLFDDLVRDAPGLATTSAWLHGRLAIAHGDVQQATAHYRAGLATSVRDGDDIPLHCALLHRDLGRLYGTTADDRARATAHLQHALDGFTDLGAAPYTRRTAAELARLQPTSAQPMTSTVRRADAAEGLLTEREQHVAHLAVQGLTNQEIARELFLSPKTIEYHLGHVYEKLQLTGRRQLRARLHPSPYDGHQAFLEHRVSP